MLDVSLPQRREAHWSARRLAFIGAWVLVLALAAYLRWAHLELLEFGIDQETAVNMGRLVHRGWEYPLVGMYSSVGPVFGPGEAYLMAIPQLLSDAPEAASIFTSLVALLSAALFSLALWRQFGPTVGIGTLALFATGPWAVHYTRKIWTPDTLPFFSAVLFLLLLGAIAGRRKWLLALALLTLGLAIQVHHSALALVPVVVVVLVVFYRRVRPLPLVVGLLLALLTLVPYVWYGMQHDFYQINRLLPAETGAGKLDLDAVNIIRTLVSGDDFPGAVRVSFPPGTQVPSVPGLATLLGLLSAVGLVATLWRTFVAWRSRTFTPAVAAGVLTLSWVLAPIGLTLWHTFPLYFRYYLYVFPVVFFFPAVGIAEVGRLAGSAIARIAPQNSAGSRQTAAAVVPAALICLAVAGGTSSSLGLYSALAATGPIVGKLAPGQMDVYTPPLLGDSRAAVSRLETIVRPDQDTVVYGLVQRGPLEYLADNRYRLRYIDTATMLVLPPARTTMIFMPDASWEADMALKLGAVERKDLSLLWPPANAKARILEFDPAKVALPAEFTPVAQHQVLPIGLELIAYSVAEETDKSFLLTTAWRVTDEKLAHQFYLYNLFTHIADLSGNQVPVGGEIEMSTSSNWRQGDTLILPARIPLEQPIQRGLYRTELGVYVRFPARVPIPPAPGTLPAAVVGNLRLGVPGAAPAGGKAMATFESGISLLQAQARPNAGNSQVDLSLVWQANAALKVDYTVFAHVYNSAGKLVAQIDGWPSAGNFPTSAWAPGEAVADPRTIPLPPELPDDTYTVKVGLYDAKTMQRLTPSPETADKAVVVGTFRPGGQ